MHAGPEKHERIAALYQEKKANGEYAHSVRDVARMMGVSQKTVNEIRKKAGLSRNVPVSLSPPPVESASDSTTQDAQSTSGATALQELIPKKKTEPEPGAKKMDDTVYECAACNVRFRAVDKDAGPPSDCPACGVSFK